VQLFGSVADGFLHNPSALLLLLLLLLLWLLPLNLLLLLLQWQDPQHQAWYQYARRP
jgi:hypothetical protein